MTTDKSSPHVSVVIPTFNRATTIAAAIASVQRQTYSDFEIVIADDGSTDGTGDVVRGLGRPNVRYVTKPNGGCSSARNFGVANARGAYIAFLDSDDEWDPRWLETVVGILDRDGDTGAVYGSLNLIGRDGSQYGVFDLSAGGRHRQATVEYVLKQCSGLLGSNVVARRELLARIGGWDETFPTSGDLDFGLRLATATRVALVATPMIQLRDTGGSLSKKVNTGNRLRVLAKFERAEPELAQQFAAVLRRSRAEILRSYGEDLLWFGDIAGASSQLWASLRMRPTLKAGWLLLKTQAFRLRRQPARSA